MVPGSLRRAAAAALAPLVAFAPAVARADEHAVSLGGGGGAYHWAGETCPYVNPCDFPLDVRHAGFGARYEGRYAEGLLPTGHALTFEARVEITRSRIVAVEGARYAGDAPANAQATLELEERARARWLGGVQIAFGYDGPLVGGRAGIGVVGTTRLVGNHVESRWLQGDEVRIPVPTFELRVGHVAQGPGARLGVGLVPIVGAGRWYTLYALAHERFANGVEIAAGGAWVVLEQTDGHAGLIASASIPAGRLRLGAFAMVDPRTSRALVDGATYGASIEARLDALAPNAPSGPGTAPVGITPIGR